MFREQHLRVKLQAAPALLQHVDLVLHLLVLHQGPFLIPLVVQEDGEVQIHQRVGSVEDRSELQKTSQLFKEDQECANSRETGTYWSKETACS